VYTAGTQLQLGAKPEDGYRFAGWQGNCRVDEQAETKGGDVKGEPTTCQLTMDQPQEVSARFVAESATLSLRYGGEGRVYSSDKLLDCGKECSATFPSGTQVTLIAEPAAGYQLTGWSKNCAPTPVANQCQVTLDTDQVVSATFAPIQTATYRLYIRFSPGGTVVSTPTGITCGKACAADFTAGAKVELIATPNPGYQFASWSGVCKGSSATCALLMDSDKDVSATFVPVQQTAARLSVVRVGSGSGRVIASLGAIDCGKACSETYTPGLIVRLYAQPDPGSTFAGWSANCDTILALTSCDVVMSQDQTVTATFSSGAADGNSKGAVKGVSTPKNHK